MSDDRKESERAEPAVEALRDALEELASCMDWCGASHRGLPQYLKAMAKARAALAAPATHPGMAEAVSAADGTLHGAIDTWQGIAEKNQRLAGNYLTLTCAGDEGRAARKALFDQFKHEVPPTPAVPPAALVTLPRIETKAMHDAVMDLLYRGVARTNTQSILDAYIAAAPAVQPAMPNRPSQEWYRQKIAETMDDDFVIGPAAPPATCPHGDKLCPCPDGDTCHYEGRDAWPAPAMPEPVAIRYRYKDGRQLLNEWILGGLGLKPDPGTFEIQILYAAPPPEPAAGEDRRDVELYRWLRTHSFAADPPTVLYFGHGFNQTRPELLDAAIRAAMSAICLTDESTRRTPGAQA